MDWKEGDPDRRSNREPEDLGWIKKALIGSIISLMANFSGGIWWAATQTAKMDFVQIQLVGLSASLKEASVDRYRGADAAKDISVLNSRIDRNEQRLASLESRVRGGV